MLKSIYRFLSPRFQTIFLDYKVNFKPRSGHGNPPNKLIYKIINENRVEYKELLNSFLTFNNVFQNIKTSEKETNQNEPTWNNKFLPGLDIIGLYGLVSILKPKKYIEIGSGNSTKIVRKAIIDNNLATKITSIDPYPRANIDHLADSVIRKPIENLEDYSFIENLDKNDILFIDNSHRCLPNSDVTVCFLELLPKLKPGVIVHIHDIYLPYDYPQFMCDRAYSEQYILAAFIIANKEKYKTILPNYFISEDKELKDVLNPIWEQLNAKNVEQHGGSYWIRIQ